MSVQRCRLCDHPMWGGQKLVRSHEGKVHRKCQMIRVRESNDLLPTNLDGYIRVPAAAALKGITREAMRRIVQKAYLPAYCENCLEILSLETLRRNGPQIHHCRKAAGQVRANVVLRQRDVEEYEVSAAAQASGRLGGLARQKK